MLLDRAILLVFISCTPLLVSCFSQDGGWSPWSKLVTPCQKAANDTTQVLCGGGVRVRYRSCTMPVPQGPDGAPCNGDDAKYEPCNLHPCMLPDEYLWSSWTLCSKTCGRGVRKRYTMCGGIRSKHLTEEEEEVQTEVATTEPAEETTMVDGMTTTNMNEETTTIMSSKEPAKKRSFLELEYEEKCQSNQYVEQSEPCNTWNQEFCPSPCEYVKCPAFSKCIDISNRTDPLFSCECQLGTVKKDDGSACIAPPPEPVTKRPNPTLSPPQKTLATVFTRGASLVLIAFLTATLLLFGIARIWDSSRVIHFNMELSLLLAHLCLLPPDLAETWPEACRFVSILIHFFHLTCFTFMFLESLHLYSLVGWVVKSDGLLTKAQNVLVGWLVPIIIVMFNLCFEYDNYGGEYHCWLQMDTRLMYGQVLPIAFMAIVSLAVVEAAGDASDYEKLSDGDHEQRKTAKIMQRTLILILPMVFASFMLGSFAEYDQNLVLYSIFTIVNGILGALIFFFHCTANETIRAKLTTVKSKLKSKILGRENESKKEED